jgi:hypothetical protein
VTRRLPSWLPYCLIALTCLIWLGVSNVSLNGDDYQYLHSFAPIHTLGDAIRPWTEHDANPHYFRPLANTTMVLDFMLFGWDGGAFHLTNVLFHLIASLLVFKTALVVFRLSRGQSLCTALIFAALASHEYNLVVDTARADILVSIFSMLAMISLARWGETRAASRYLLACLFYGLALTSKEAAYLMLPVFVWQIVRFRGLTARTVIRFVLPMLAISVLFWWYHDHYTMTALSSNEVIDNASLKGILMNAAQSVGYLIVPMSQQSALELMDNPLLLAVLGFAFIGIVWITFRLLSAENRRLIALPTFVMVVTGLASWLVFERWRLYLPSVGGAAMLSICATAFLRRKGAPRLFGLVAILLFSLYHIGRAVASQSEWQASTALMQDMKADLARILSTNSARPIAFVLVTEPAKLGSAGVMILGVEALAQQAEAERLGARGLEYASVDTASVKVDVAIHVFALDAAMGYKGLAVDRIGPSTFRVSAPSAAQIRLVPAALGTGAVRTRVDMRQMDTLSNIIMTSYTQQGTRETMEFQLRDSLATPIVFDGHHLRLSQ